MINRKKIILFIIIIPLCIAALCLIPLFNNVDSSKHKVFNDICNKHPNDTVYILKYISTTGSSWEVTKCSDSRFEGDCVSVASKFDPRLLKINNDFYFDRFGNIIVVGDTPSNFKYQGEIFSVIDAQKIYISLPNEKDVFRIGDMSFGGLIKSLLGIFVKYCRLSK